MNNIPKAVIGSGWGDEGKGNTVNYLSNDSTVCVRFNSSAQAGHTVVTPDGDRHVFSHLSSGSFRGARTFLSEYFVSSPMLFSKELHEINQQNLPIPEICVNKNGYVTTPYDMLINQIVEEVRGTSKHGSCGVGFGETIERSEFSPYVIRVEDLKNHKFMIDKLLEIKNVYVPERLKQLNVDEIPLGLASILNNTRVIKCYMEDIKTYLSCIHVCENQQLDGAPNIVFEGAQGLLLDQDNKQFFPHVTRSNTGLKNVLSLCEEANIDEIDVYYVTRTYSTRHGAGPFPHERKEKIYSNIADLTNVHNKFQGSLRFGYLDLDILSDSIYNDLNKCSNNIKINPHIMITCIDQLDWNLVHYYKNGLHLHYSFDIFMKAMKETFPNFKFLGSYGPSSMSICELS